MDHIITYPFGEDFIVNLADHIEKEYIRQGRDLGRLAIVFGGKRPALFLKRELARRCQNGFLSPKFFTMDEFVRYTVAQKEIFSSPRDLEQCYLVFRLIRKSVPHILKGRETFAKFLPWVREILAFIDQLDLEDVDNKRLLNVQANAAIGYAVPDDVNRLLAGVVSLRESYHAHMQKHKIYSRGFCYRQAAGMIGQVDFAEFDHIFFCNFFSVNRCQQRIFAHLYRAKKAVLVFQGDERRWMWFQKFSALLDAPIREAEDVHERTFDLKLYSGFDSHSQVGIVRQVLKKIKDLEKTVIVLPDASQVIPLLAQLGNEFGELNVSLGYPLKRSSFYALLEAIFKAQLSRKDNAYYARDYLKVLRHPLVKTLYHDEATPVTRVLVHKIEEILTGKETTAVSGSLFFPLDDIENCDDLLLMVKATLGERRRGLTKLQLRRRLMEIHDLVFRQWQDVGDFGRFAERLEHFLNVFTARSTLAYYPLNLRTTGRLLDICGELQAAGFHKESFPDEDIFNIFRSRIERDRVSFTGSPLKGLQILGMLETRALNFDHVIVMDMNEGVLPRLNIFDPLIPREVMVALNIDRLEREEEIQRYNFMRLIASAKSVHLVYQESKDKERSRFAEELIWEEEKKAGRTRVVPVVASGFDVEIVPVSREVRKAPAVVSFLKDFTYSASSVDTYLRNPWEFYMNYVLGLREPDDLLAEPENRRVGNFVHELLEATFKRFLGHKPVIDERFRKYFRKVRDEKFEETFSRNMKSEAFLLKSVLDERLERFLDLEAERARQHVKEIVFLEKRFEDTIPLPSGQVKFVYKLDRVDLMEDGTIMIIDYKTGSHDPVPKALDRIEAMDLTRAAVARDLKSFQIPLYFYYLDKHYAQNDINAAFYNLRNIALHPFMNQTMTSSRQRIKAAFLRALDFVIREIRDPNIPFQDHAATEF